tara:strand:- start:1600 stop:1989 length:390 start_codon:yes stop_codon:yes gene_type:complete
MALISKSFQDFSLTFEKNAVTDDVLALKNEAAIKASVKNIVMYNYYEKPFDPQFGGNIIGLLFENFTPRLAGELAEELETVINLYEPRVTVYEVKSNQIESRNELNVSIQYLINGIPPTFDSIDLVLKP